MAKALINERFKRITALGIQIHGAIGFTEDHDLPLYFRRAKAWEVNLGDTNFHLDKIAQAAQL
jgi:alkylation response protein AidB-like acyl-CoA dehydrogenase